MYVPPLDEVLKEVNAVRVALGGKPLIALRKGEQGKRTCSLVRSLQAESLIPNANATDTYLAGLELSEAMQVSDVFNIIYTGESFVRLSGILGDFVRAFDQGKYPQLILHHKALTSKE